MYALLFSTLLAALAPAGPVKWSFTAERHALDVVVVELTAHVEPGWHIYATQLENDLGPIPTTIRFERNEALFPVGELNEPKPEEVFDPNFEMQVRYHSGAPLFTQHFEPVGKGALVLKGEVEFMVCNDKTCLPPEVVEFSLDVAPLEVKP